MLMGLVQVDRKDGVATLTLNNPTERNTMTAEMVADITEAMNDIDKVTQQDLIDFGSRVHAKAQRADAVLVSCGGFRTLELIAPLEARTGVPVISSMPHGLWAGAKLVGLDGAAPGYGRLLSK
jgi:maleate cis-trans isomerase